ncbi:MAG: methylmalonyl-CoA epimerase [Dehalococcoidia bacterium]|nr:methylmalonyl-CoA epimerase [Dehalococcoidia bacterium]
MFDRIHHVGVVLPDADAALGFFRDVMGLKVTADQVVEEQGVRGVLLQLGENEIELLQPVQPDTGVARFLESRGPTLHHICLNTDNILDELQRLKELQVDLIDETPRDGLAGKVAFIHPKAMHGVLVELAQPPVSDTVAHGHGKGFDHLAVTVADYKGAKAKWRLVAGLEVTNEIFPPGRDMVIGQMPCGQTMIELLAATAPDSPMAKRIEEQGERASSMVAIEVAEIDAEVARYRSAGYTLPDPAPGALPDSVTSTISAEQAFGLAIQLIQFGRSA